MLRRWIFFGQQIIGDPLSRCPEHIRNDEIQGDVTDGETVLEAILLAAAHIGELRAVACKFTQYAYVFAGDEAAFDKAEAEQLGNPFGIFGIVFVPLHCTHPFRVGNHNVHFRCEYIEDGNSVFAGGFHTNVITTIFDEPIFEPLKIFVERGEAFLLVRECLHLGYGYNRDNEKVFVNIDATADGVNNFHIDTPQLASPCFVEYLSSQEDYTKEGRVTSFFIAICAVCDSNGMEFTMPTGDISTVVPAIAMTDAADAASPSILTVTLPE